MWKRLRNWHADLSQGAKVVFWAFVALFFIITGNIGQHGQIQNVAKTTQTQAQASTEQAQGQPKQKAKPTVTTRKETEDEPIPYETQKQDDASMDSGKTATAVKGVDGVKTTTFEVTLTNGKETARKQIGETITKQPVAEVVHVGTKVAARQAPAAASTSTSNCDPNYSGACVPIASDVDCAGGSGNGPAYVAGPVRVVGTDIYHLDSNGNGIGCE